MENLSASCSNENLNTAETIFTSQSTPQISNIEFIIASENPNVHAKSIESIQALINAENQATKDITQDFVNSGHIILETPSKEVADEAIFKKPLSALVKMIVDDADKTGDDKQVIDSDKSVSDQRNYKIVDSNTNKIQNIIAKRKKVDITTSDYSSKFYDIKPPYCTDTIVPTRLPEAFESLPKVGKVESKSELLEQQNKLLREFLGNDINDIQFRDLEKYCSPDNLRTGSELQLSNDSRVLSFLDTEDQHLLSAAPPLDEGVLRTVDKYRMKLELDQKNLFMRSLKYRGMTVVPVHLRSTLPDDKDGNENSQSKVLEKGADSESGATGSSSQSRLGSSSESGPRSTSKSGTGSREEDDTLQPGKDLLITIRVYRPFSYHPKERVLSNGRHPLLAYDLVVWGRQPLRLLRRWILCVNDVGLRVDVSAAPAQPAPLSCQELFPSGYLFINNVFYVDNRPGCSDQSAVIREWAEKKQIGNYAVRDMDGVTFQELQFKLGHPEVYVHQGNCEHLFTFSSVRLVTAGDPPRGRLYPRHAAAARCQTVYCTTCAEFPTKYLVTGCELVPFDPAMFCETCLQLYLYKDGRKIRDFKVYQYHYNDIGVGRT